MPKKKKKISKAQKWIMSIPAIVSAALVVTIKVNQQRALGGAELFSPVASGPIVTALVIFTVGYVIFLSLMFSENVENFFWKLIKH